MVLIQSQIMVSTGHFIFKKYEKGPAHSNNEIINTVQKIGPQDKNSTL